MLMSVLRLVLGFFCTAVLTGLLMVVLVLAIPLGRRRRIVITNHFGTVLGSLICWLAGAKIEVSGREWAQGPAIFANNHTSNLDAFLTIWLTPLGTMGLAKKEIIWYPVYGLAWVLSGHPTVDRKSPERAQASMQALGERMRKERLSLCMLPEGTRSRTGRLLPFKKGIVHLAVQTQLPIVPMVTMGAHGAWDKGSFRLRPRLIRVRFLPPVDTDGWQLEHLDEHLQELRNRFVDALPDSMLEPHDLEGRERRNLAV